MAVTSVSSRPGSQMGGVSGVGSPVTRMPLGDLRVISAYGPKKSVPSLGQYNNSPIRNGIGFELADNKGNMLAFYSSRLLSLVLIGFKGNKRAEVNIGEDGKFEFVCTDKEITPADMAGLWKKAAKYTSDFKSGLIGVDKFIRGDFAKSSENYATTFAALEGNE